MELELTGRVAIVSGASRGIGRATAERLVAEGCSVVLTGRTERDLDETAAELDGIGAGRVEAVAADMRDGSGVDRVVKTARSRFGPVGIAVSNVIGHVINPEREGDGPGAGFFVSMPSSGYAEEFRSLLVSAWMLARATTPDMKELGWGRIVNVGSIVAREPMTELPHVLPNTVRPAVAGLHRVLAHRLAPHGVTVNNVLTGFILTERNRSYFEWLAGQRGVPVDELIAAATAPIPLRRMGTPDEMAAVISFLCSQRAARVTGQSIPVAGGYTRHL